MHHIKPTIQKPNNKQRVGKGFSPDEVAQAGLNRLQAKQMGLPVDYRRKTAHQENVDAIKAHAQKAKAQAKPKPQKAEAKS